MLVHVAHVGTCGMWCTTPSVPLSCISTGFVRHSMSLPLDIWKFQISGYCDISTLLRLQWVVKELYRYLNTPTFVVSWQEACWFLQRRGCPCDRNIFYLDTIKYCDFAFEYSRWRMNHMYDVDVQLRHMGRSISMMQAADCEPENGYLIRAPYVDPQTDPDWSPGLCQAYMEELTIIMPRMTRYRVEDTRLVNNHIHAQRMLHETDEHYNRRHKWRNFHEIPVNEEVPRSHNVPESGFTHSTGDLVRDFIQSARTLGVDPFDPMDTNECEGHLASLWARRIMYETPVGVQAYPLDLCVTEEQLDDWTDRRGADYVERMFLNPQEYDRTMDMMLHRGPIYYTGYRYENERGDFTNWALATLGVLNTSYKFLWMDHALHILGMVHQFLVNLSSEIQDETPQERVQARWAYVVHLMSCEGCTQYVHSRPPADNSRDRHALDFLQRPAYAVYHRLVRHAVESSHYWDEPYASTYLATLIPGGPMTGRNREADILTDLHLMCELASYMVEFGECMASQVGPRTRSTRRRTLTIYLHTTMSLIAFCPTWKRAYEWRPSRTHCYSSVALAPRMNLTRNHRFQYYLGFLNLRSLYYHPDPVIYVNALCNSVRYHGEYGPFAIEPPNPETQQQTAATGNNTGINQNNNESSDSEDMDLL